MRTAHALDPMPTWPVRKQRLDKLQNLILDNRSTIREAISADFGQRPAEETDAYEITPTMMALRNSRRRGRRWMRPRRRWADLWFLPARTELRAMPLGVVGIIVPWNYPLLLAAGPLIDALTAGNRVLVKMSEFTPRFSALFAKLVAETYANDEVVVITGDAKVAQEFSALPFDHLLFTGSTAVGREVMRTAAANLTPVTLELGGKSPAIVGRDARLENAVERILVGKLVNAGQTCIAPDYVVLPRAYVADFIACAKVTAARLYPDLATNPQCASIASDRHFARLAKLRDTAIDSGATAHPLSDAPADAARRLLPPILLTDVDWHMDVMRDEIFGPVLPLVAYEDVGDALRDIAARPKPLALYVFSDDDTFIERVLTNIAAGGVTLNDTLFHITQNHLPFGGIGTSGMGAYGGEAGFRTFSRTTPIFRQARWNGAALLSPPYGKALQRLLSVFLRR